ncbi:hypothetical protein NDR77_13575 [Pseudomonas aeruginosa]|jgi:hypothetical protein|uniref:hypothetical protein n=1 Tax=Pseudomonadaceae TaxID=135621 RepID=UPI000D22AAA3|nr:hypothetical protein [Stutzerimonas stutzeri]MCM5667042.1 hypothetical protein [Pseudomonas aeruginosa]HCW94814.1 hypothetical protein [Pseudomonas sp.]AVX11476.1 hypothetical protein CXB48_01225 [Stutzerimonas stutzeri]MCC8342834.1 hypothetical protein [Stutzerimonas stutzeri]HBN7642417.1 hypothetical protein [Pseudomonas aeruginosa]
MSHDTSAKDYRSSMQAAAKAYLLRHQDEHLADDERLYDRACRYLVQGLDVPAFMAPRLVHLAMTELSSRVGIDRGLGDETRLCLVLVRTGERAFIPTRYLPLRLQPPAALPAAAAAH